MDSVKSLIADNYARVSQRMEETCRRVGRRTSDVRLVAVTKSADIRSIKALLTLGVRDLGESRPQKLCERAAVLDRAVEWHLIGHLQRNKIRKVLPVASWIHSVDSLSLLRRLDEVAGEICDLVVKVAAGGLSASELLGHREFVLGYKSFEPIGPACHPAPLAMAAR